MIKSSGFFLARSQTTHYEGSRKISQAASSFFFLFSLQAIDIFMSSCTVFVFLSLIEYAFVNVMMGDISEVERKDKASHLRSIILTANHVPYVTAAKYSNNHQIGGIDEAAANHIPQVS